MAIMIILLLCLGAMGYILRINELGDSEGNYSLIARDVLEEDSDQYGMYPVGVFRLNENLSALPVSLLIYLHILFTAILISMNHKVPI